MEEEVVQAIRFVRAGEFVSHPVVTKKLLKHAASQRPVTHV